MTGISKVKSDNLFLSFCADGFNEVCTAKPHCGIYPISDWCKGIEHKAFLLSARIVSPKLVRLFICLKSRFRSGMLCLIMLGGYKTWQLKFLLWKPHHFLE